MANIFPSFSCINSILIWKCNTEYDAESAPGTCGRAFRRKNKLCVRVEETHDLHEVPYVPTLKLRELLLLLSEALHQPVESLRVSHKATRYQLSEVSKSETALQDLGIEDNAILSVSLSPSNGDTAGTNAVPFFLTKSQASPVLSTKSRTSRSPDLRVIAASGLEVQESRRSGTSCSNQQEATQGIGRGKLPSHKHINPFDIDFRVYAVPDLLAHRQRGSITPQPPK